MAKSENIVSQNRMQTVKMIKLYYISLGNRQH
jgi:hypothetical protein